VVDYLLEVSSLLVRWLHLIAGIAWIGASFYFVWLDNHLDPSPEEGVAGELWSVHGGGFYNKRKYLVAPSRLPERLHWFKWEAYWTWISGFTLLAIVYYAHPDAYLTRPGGSLSGGWCVALSIALLVAAYVAYDLVCRSPLATHGYTMAILALVGSAALVRVLGDVYSGRGAYIQVGAMLGTMMAANVLAVIIPGQRRVVRAMLAGIPPNPEDGRRAKQRSVHNNYLTLPVLFVMVSNHYAFTYGSESGWAIFATIATAGMLIRHFVTLRQRGRIVVTPLLAAGALLVGMIVALAPPVQWQAGFATTTPAANPALDAQAVAIIASRCTGCHALHPTIAGYTAAPMGIALDDPSQVAAHRSDIGRVVGAQAMPLGNATHMTADERATIASWAGG
jgi:uncharacterized membrane protein